MDSSVMLVLMTALVQVLGGSQLSIVDTGYVPYQVSSFEAGPEEGSILNAHFFPGIAAHAGGYYSSAERELSYVIVRPQYFDENPRQGEFMSTAHYLRGTIYLDHARGVGRYVAAKEDFEAAIMWNSRNYSAYLELGRVYETLGFLEEAAKVFDELLEMDADPSVVERARMSLHAIRERVNADVVGQ